ncbi:MAG: diphthine synthase [Candidatus Woesearchaeota archaeon]
MTLYLIGLGLEDEKSITLNGLEAIRNADFVFLENYTSKLVELDINKMELLFGKKIDLAERSFLENNEKILELSKKRNVVILTPGDPMVATTHIQLKIDAEEKKIPVVIINNTSVINALGNLGLEIYKLGKITSIPFAAKSFFPETPYDVIKENNSINAHTLCLLDLKPEEQKFMSFNEALEYLLNIENKRKENVLNKETLVLGCAALGSKKQMVVFGKIDNVIKKRFLETPQCLVVLSKLHFIEESSLKRYLIK